MLEIIIVFIVILVGFKIPKLLNINKKWYKIFDYLWLFHLIVTVLFYFYIVGDTSSDSMRFWNTSKLLTADQIFAYIKFGSGTGFMFVISYLFSVILQLNYITTNFIFSLFGYIGFVLFAKIAINNIQYNSKMGKIVLFPFLFFLPNLHFWTVALGKDTLLFLCISIFFSSIQNIKRNALWILFSLVLSYFIRPHITLFLIVSFGLVHLFHSKTNKMIKILILISVFGIIILLIPKLKQITGIEDASVDNLIEYSDNKATTLSGEHTGSRVDISSYPFPLKLFTFIYRPLFFDINGFPSIVASFENLILILMSIKFLRNKPLKTIKTMPDIIKNMIIFFIVGALLFSQILGNLGIMLRMRNMFLPCLIIFFLWSFSKKNNIINSKK